MEQLPTYSHYLELVQRDLMLNYSTNPCPFYANLSLNPLLCPLKDNIILQKQTYEDQCLILLQRLTKFQKLNRKYQARCCLHRHAFLCFRPQMQHNPLTATKMFQIGDQDQRSEGFRIETIICMSIDYFWHTNNQTINLLGK